MLNVRQILVSTRARAALMVCLVAGAAGLVACGQRGALYLPTDPAAAGRATLPQLMTPESLRSSSSSSEAAPAPAAAASAPASNSTEPRK
ncbi:LPS translocon maturation chaperone LptM [Variovorax sp. YR566]|jgi:predicted small lipoprotein YifL|uniref:LPS translocon maturation chaperone LptM n=1 Tax=Variovorax sp. YR566 TaxID=3450237 RepID=UPI000B812D7A